MPFNIRNYKAHVGKYNYLPKNSYEVTIAPPKIMINNDLLGINTDTSVNNVINLLKYRAQDIVAPGISLVTTDVMKYGIGTMQKFPATAQFTDIKIVFLSDGYGQIWQFWHNWIKSIFDFTSISDANTGQTNRTANYTATYKDDYSTIMQLIIYDNTGTIIQSINLFEAFPVDFEAIPLSWESQNDLIKITITITFKEYNIQSSVLKVLS